MTQPVWLKESVRRKLNSLRNAAARFFYDLIETDKVWII